MSLIMIIIVGGVLGWLASIMMRTDGQQGIFLSIVVGMVGALVASFLLNPMIGGGNIMAGDFSIGALALLAAVNLLRRGSVR